MNAAALNANFESERAKLAKDFTGKGGGPAPKYFRKLNSLVPCLAPLVSSWYLSCARRMLENVQADTVTFHR